MASRQIESVEEVEDFVRGSTFLGTGGGGTPDSGINRLKKELEKENTIELTDVSDIDDDDWTACPFLMGSIAPETEEMKEKRESIGLTEPEYEDLLDEAVLELEEYTDTEIDVIVPIELGGGNTAQAVAAATNLDKTAVDGDYTGRAIPEIPQTTPYLKDKPMWPISSVDEWGDVSIIRDAANYEIAERVGKKISEAAFGLAGDCGFLMKGSDLKEILVEDTLTESLEIGKSIREARESGEDPVQALIDTTDGTLLFKGEVVEKDWWDEDGYYWGTHLLKGYDEYEGHEFKYWFKNENHISWLDEEPYVTSPDIFSAVDLETGEPKTNPDVEEGDELAIIGLEARDEFRTEKGLEILGPGHFGFEVEYTPIEELMH